MLKRIIECVPNFSEGQDMNIINAITDSIKTVEGVKLLDVDPGKDTNRTVVTFVGEPENVIEAAFVAIKKASELIDMSKHSGKHPRMGATDVCPLIPVSNISMEETVEFARKLAKRVGEELQIPIYCYENAAFNKERSNLSVIREGEYEGLQNKLANPEWKPDFGPAKFNSKTGATVIGARSFLVAFNINLNTTSTRRANSIAFDVRERGRIKREGDKITGKIIKDSEGNPVYEPGSLKAVKAIGWFIEEYGIAQISMNLTDVNITPVHVVFEEVCKKANERGIRVTGGEIVGLMPLKTLIDAGKYFLKKQQRSVGVSEQELIKIAVKSLGLDDLKPFNAKEKVIEYLLEDEESKKLVDLSIVGFTNETASESAAPGGGSISAAVGAFGIALATMVANLSAHKRGWDDKWELFSNWAEKGENIKNELIKLIDIDTLAFNKIMDAFSLPKTNEEETAIRKKAIQDATKYAIEVPFSVMEHTFKAMEIIKEMTIIGNPNSVTDAGVGALCARTAIMGAFLNVKINSSGYNDKEFVNDIIKRGTDIEQKAILLEKEILDIVNQKIKL
ncbi:MAG: glutamate formimidoyltransferase [Bacteroidetes bacterium GWF2_29_10]|nr:MAG: glutamate formimidoyltransferase [Bacteroidetes bacterium GWF2_29_10]